MLRTSPNMANMTMHDQTSDLGVFEHEFDAFAPVLDVDVLGGIVLFDESSS
jgi:hypothetical protein